MFEQEFTIGDKLPGLVDRIVASYHREQRIQNIDRKFLPHRRSIVDMMKSLIELLYPGYWGRQDLTDFNVSYHVGDLLPKIGRILHEQITQCLCYRSERDECDFDCGCEGQDPKPCSKKAAELAQQFLTRIPDIREMLSGDAQAAFDGDPAALNTDEIILSYPGLLTITIHRCAHELYKIKVPLMPRIMSEWAHNMTGIDIHPGAQIGRNFFIDHGTGVVIGETCEIGNNVKIYQGVTLGALSFPKDERGNLIRGTRRHPKVEDNVTIYANAIVLGGETILGKGSVIGGSVFVTESVPAGATVTLTPPELRIRHPKEKPSV